MPAITSQIDTGSEPFARNREQMLAAIEEVRAAEQRVRANSERARTRFEKRGALLPRERLARLLDRGAAFVELSTLAGLRMHDDDGAENASGGGVITGIGFVSGVRCVVTVSDSGIKGGAVAPMGLQKNLRAQELARLNALPLINMVESGGANLLYQSEIFIEGGRIFCNMARLSAAGIPVITLVHGSSTAGGAYFPGMSDYVVAVRGLSKIFLGGPPLVRAATGEIATDEELGGAEMHATVSGTVEYVAEDDAHAVAIAREVVSKLGWNQGPAAGARAFLPPRYSAEELPGIVPCDLKKPYDVHEVIARLVDDSDFLDFKPGYGAATVCGQAAIEGHAVGIIGNNGPIDAAGSAKAAQFIQLCCQAGTSIIYLQNTTGYMIGRDAERAGIVKHGSKMLQAVANATVPQLTLLIGGSYGAGNYGMCGRALDPRFIFAWPNSRTAVMGGEQAARVMSIITEAKLERLGRALDPEGKRQMEQGIIAQVEKESTALYATARLWDDGIIDPRDSREVLAFCLAVCREAAARRLRPNTFGVARM